jgi:hypothetical protein
MHCAYGVCLLVAVCCVVLVLCHTLALCSGPCQGAGCSKWLMPNVRSKAAEVSAEASVGGIAINKEAGQNRGWHASPHKQHMVPGSAPAGCCIVLRSTSPQLVAVCCDALL